MGVGPAVSAVDPSFFAAGLLCNGLVEVSLGGSPQGGPLTPIMPPAIRPILSMLGKLEEPPQRCRRGGLALSGILNFNQAILIRFDVHGYANASQLLGNALAFRIPLRRSGAANRDLDEVCRT